MSQFTNATFGDKERMNDALSSQKAAAAAYNNAACECASPALKSEMMNILSEEHQIGHEIFTELQKRGWYQTSPAQPEKINTVLKKYQSANQ